MSTSIDEQDIGVKRGDTVDESILRK
jgi:hypothetical protein